jgi:hypothetical protein
MSPFNVGRSIEWIQDLLTVLSSHGSLILKCRDPISLEIGATEIEEWGELGVRDDFTCGILKFLLNNSEEMSHLGRRGNIDLVEIDGFGLLVLGFFRLDFFLVVGRFAFAFGHGQLLESGFDVLLGILRLTISGASSNSMGTYRSFTETGRSLTINDRLNIRLFLRIKERRSPKHLLPRDRLSTKRTLPHVLLQLFLRQVAGPRRVIPQVLHAGGTVAMTAFRNSFSVFVFIRLETDWTFRSELVRIFAALGVLLNFLPSIFEHLSDLVDVLLTHVIESSLEFLHVVK